MEEGYNWERMGLILSRLTSLESFTFELTRGPRVDSDELVTELRQILKRNVGSLYLDSVIRIVTVEFKMLLGNDFYY